jgi:ubiquinone/menaquinone biosynthesis C-methylase UbiE
VSKEPGRTGSVEEFDRNWNRREETLYNHWTAGEPVNQIQLAFRSHWKLFQELMGPNFKGRRVLEVGCGRASISSYFAQNGFDVTCLDLSEKVLQVAEEIYKKNNLKAKFVQGNALDLAFPDGSFDVNVSIGLLEHFEDLEKLLSEQVRVLAPGGLFLGYVVPENKTNIQKDYEWVNEIIRLYTKEERKNAPVKDDIFRSDYLSEPYLKVLKKLPIKDVQASGVYPLPMISPSPEFPFTLMPPAQEKVLVDQFTKILAERARTTGKNGWLCDETYGQAFLIWGRKV